MPGIYGPWERKPQKLLPDLLPPEETATPLMAQYLAVKAQHQDCLVFFRLGDFYEMFFEDAVKASRALDIALTRRGQMNGEDVPMCGVPAHSYETYLAKLIPQRFPRRDLRTERIAGRSQKTRRKIHRRARCRAHRHARHDYRRKPAGCACCQLPGLPCRTWAMSWR